MVIKLGMSKEAVSENLIAIGADDISSGMQATADAPKSDWMWTLSSPEVSIETLYTNDKLSTLHVWDWTDRQMTSYHHTLTHDEVDSLTLHGNGTFESNVIRTHQGISD